MTGRAKKAAPAKRKANGYKMPAPIPLGEVIVDAIAKKKWRIGPSIGVGGFGEIYSACDHDNAPKNTSSYPFVVKIEPHENGPLFVEKHFYLRNASKDDITSFMKTKKLSSLGMPTHFGNGSHTFKGEKYRYLVLERYGKDVGSIFATNKTLPVTTVFILGLQMLEVLEYIHSKGYVHADVKGANILLGMKKGTENQAYLVDFGLASRINDKEFKPDPKCAHNGTIEYTSRDAHLGVATMRGDLEILGYNMLHWITGALPWDKQLKNPKKVQEMKEVFMSNVRSTITKDYPSVPDALIKFFEYINTLKPKQEADFTKCQKLFEMYLKTQNKTRTSKLEFIKISNNIISPEMVPRKRGRNSKKSPVIETENISQDSIDATEESAQSDQENIESDSENDKPIKKLKKAKTLNNTAETKVKTKKPIKRKSVEAVISTKVKKVKLTPKIKQLVNTSTQTSLEKRRRSQRYTLDNSTDQNQSHISIINTESPDIIEDSFEDKKVVTKRKLLPRDLKVRNGTESPEVFDRDSPQIKKKVPKKKLIKEVKIEVTRKVTTKGSWRDSPAVVNGKGPVKK